MSVWNFLPKSLKTVNVVADVVVVVVVVVVVDIAPCFWQPIEKLHQRRRRLFHHRSYVGRTSKMPWCCCW